MKTVGTGCLIAVFLISGAAYGQIGNWRTYTYLKEIRKLAASDGQIWATTSGGLLNFDPSSGRFTSLTNVDGLASNDLAAIAADKNRRIWIGHADGTINIYDPQSRRMDVIIDYQRFAIQHFYPFGDTVYIALDIGLGEYRIDKQEPKELYRQLGTRFPKEIPVTSVLVHDGFLYVGTEYGIAKADLNIPNLKAPQSWSNIDRSQGLPANEVRDLEVFAGRVVAATAAGLAVETDSLWQEASGGLGDKDILALAAYQAGDASLLYAATSAAIYKTADLNTWTRLPSPGSLTDILVQDGLLWAGIHQIGLGVWDNLKADWVLYDPGGPKTNLYSALFFDPRRILWCTSPTRGFFAFDGEQWYNFDDHRPLSYGDYRAVVADQQGRVWLGSWGNGLILLEGDLQNPRLTKIDTTGGYLAGSTPVNPGFVVVNALTLDQQGNLWLTNFDALDGRVIAAVSPDFQWAYFSVSQGVKFTNMTRIMVDRFNRVWYGSESRGIEVLDWGGTLFNPADDNPALGLIDAASLFSPQITAIAEDQDGTIWIGTPKGLHYVFNDRLSNFFGTGAGSLISTDIRTIRVDPANNKWIGTSGGVTVLMADNFNLMHFTTDNSPIVSNSITDFAFDGETGDVYIATTNGLSVVSTPFTAPQKDFSLLTGFPNPFIVDNSGGQFTIKNLVRNSGVSIYTENGRLVRSYEPGSIPGSQVIWDGRDAEGQVVPGGIYIFVAFTEDGIHGTGKVAVIRK